jgi:hypothetical protein
MVAAVARCCPRHSSLGRTASNYSISEIRLIVVEMGESVLSSR